MKRFIDLAGEVAPYLIVGLVFVVTVSSLVSLILVDIITGQITGDYLSGDKLFGLFGSLAGTGMLIACGVLIATLWEKENYIGAFAVIVVFLALQSADVYFDGISVDIKRFSHIVSTASFVDRPEAIAHNIYRFFVAGISFVGEPLGVGSLVAFPLLKKWLIGILDIEKKLAYTPKHRPAHLGAQASIPMRPASQMSSRPAPRPAQRHTQPAQVTNRPQYNARPQNFKEPVYRPIGFNMNEEEDERDENGAWG